MSLNQIVTKAIVLTRTDFQEADRIITMLTPDHGKIRVIAKGVRRVRSKLAGGIELFSISNITYLPGRKEIGTLVSSRLITHYGEIVKDIDRTMLGYELLKRVNRTTEDAAGEEYFTLLEKTLTALNNFELSIGLVELWFTMRLLKITGHSPNLLTDASGNILGAENTYLFSYDDMAFAPVARGPFTPNHIKLLRLGIGTSSPEKLLQLQADPEQTQQSLQLAKTMLNRLLRV